MKPDRVATPLNSGRLLFCGGLAKKLISRQNVDDISLAAAVSDRSFAYNISEDTKTQGYCIFMRIDCAIPNHRHHFDYTHTSQIFLIK